VFTTSVLRFIKNFKSEGAYSGAHGSYSAVVSTEVSNGAKEAV
jgi:hypothetical protein